MMGNSPELDTTVLHKLRGVRNWNVRCTEVPGETTA